MPLQPLLFALLALSMGGLTSIYLPMNSLVAKVVGSPLLANIPFYVFGAITTLLLCGLTGSFEDLGKLREVPSYLYLSGVVSAVMILSTTFLIPRLGAASFFVLLVLGQIGVAMTMSHFGLLASPQDPITFRKLIGLGLLAAGVVLSR